MCIAVENLLVLTGFNSWCLANLLKDVAHDR
jgi:hypothetical protein